MEQIEQVYMDKAEVLIEALPYIQRFNRKIVVIKYGGAAMQSEELKKSVIEDVVLLKLVGFKPIIVHGGGKEISHWMERTGKESKFIDGLRVTDEETLEIAEMVLAKVNSDLVRHVESLGVKAMGVSGKDGHLLETVKKPSEHDLGFVGDVVNVNGKVLTDLLDDDYLPIVYTIGMDKDFQSYNINADDAACAIAKALKAEKLAFLSDTEGVMLDVDDPNSVIPEMYVDEALALIEDGTIAGGMIPKVENSIAAIEDGVNRVHILDGRLHHSILMEIFTNKGVGTAIMSHKEERYFSDEKEKK